MKNGHTRIKLVIKQIKNMNIEFIKIGRRVYNTTTAKVIGVKHRESRKEYFTETLYKKRNGEYFVDAHITNKKTGYDTNHIFVISDEVAKSTIWQKIYNVSSRCGNIITVGSYNKCRKYLQKVDKKYHSLYIVGNDGKKIKFTKRNKNWCCAM